MNQETIQKFVRLIQTRRNSWKIQVEDNVIKIGTGAISVEWEIIEELVNIFKCKVRDVQANNNTIIITLVTDKDGII